MTSIKVSKAEKEFRERQKAYEAQALREKELLDKRNVAVIQANINARNAIIDFSERLLSALEPFDGKVMNKTISKDLMDSLTILRDCEPDANGWIPREFSCYMRYNVYRYSNIERDGLVFVESERVSISTCSGISVKIRKLDRVYKNDEGWIYDEVDSSVSAEHVFREFEYPIYTYTPVMGGRARYSHAITSEKIREAMNYQREKVNELKPFLLISSIQEVKDIYEDLKKKMNALYNATPYEVREIINMKS